MHWSATPWIEPHAVKRPTGGSGKGHDVLGVCPGLAANCGSTGCEWPRGGARDGIGGKSPGRSPWQVIADLDHLNHNTEQDFLRIGDKLSDFNLISCDLKALGA